MSHITVGERMIGQSPEMLGHVIRGAGHFIEQGTGMVQELARHMPEIPFLVNRSLPDFSNPQSYNNWQWSTLSANYGSGSLMAGNNESSAWDNYMEHPRTQNSLEVMRETALAFGSAAAGDVGGALGHAAEAAEKSFDGMVRDLGFKGGWGDWGPTPGQGTCPPVPDNGR